MKRYLVAGLLLRPPRITLWVLHFLVTTLDQTLLLFPEVARPDALIGFHIPGFGALLSFGISLLTGVIAANFFGARLIRFWEGVFGRIPVVKSIYSSVKQVSDTLLSDSGNAFRKALLVEFPHENAWTIAFLTGLRPRRSPPICPRSTSASTCRPRRTRRPVISSSCRARARSRHDGRRSPEVRHFDGVGAARSPQSAAATAAGRRRAVAGARRNRPRYPEIDRAACAPEGGRPAGRGACWRPAFGAKTITEDAETPRKPGSRTTRRLCVSL